METAILNHIQTFIMELAVMHNNPHKKHNKMMTNFPFNRMKNSCTKTAEWNDSQPTVNRRSTDSQLQRHTDVSLRQEAAEVSNHALITRLSPRNHPLWDAIWKHVAMIFAVLVMSIANIGMAWGAVTYHSIVPNIDKTNYETYYLYSNGAAASSTNVVGTAFSSSKLTYTTACSSWVEGNPSGKDNSSSPGDFSAQGFYKTDAGDLKYNGTSMTFHVTNCVGVALLGKGNSNTKPLQISVKEKDSSSEVGSVASTTGNSVMVLTYGTTLNASKKYDITITSVSGGNSYAYQIRFEAPDGGGSSYSITYHCNDATSGCPATNPATEQTALPSPLPTVTKTNYTFGGWYTDAAYSSAASAGASLSDDADLYAKWTQTITLDREGATTGSTSVTATYNSATLPSITNPTKDGFVFEGWYDGDNGTGNLVINTSGALQANVSGYTGADGIWTSATARTLYAKWTEKTCPSSGTLYTAAVKSSVSSNQSFPASVTTEVSPTTQADITGGQLFAINGESSAKNLIASSSGYKFCMTNNSTKFKLVLECELQAGDIITIDGVGGTKNDAPIGLWVSSSDSRPGSAPACSGTSTTTSLVDDIVNYTVTSSDEYHGKSILYIHRAVGSSTYFNNINISRPAAPSCTAPNHVDISGRWDRFGGETISLTATAYSSAGTGSPIADGDITGWQWEKLIGSTWTALSNGTVDGVTTSGATTKNLQIANCGAGNSGKYRCVVSTGATCSTASATATDGSEGHGVKVYVLECYNGGTTEHHFTRTGDSQAGTLTMTLTANTAYIFKVHADNTYYGNNGTINKDEANWVMCNSDNGGDCANNLTVNSGLGGTFTFGIEYSTSGSSSVEGEPEISVTYPRKTMYLVPNSDWLSNSAKFAFYYYGTSGTGWTDFLSSNDCGMSADIPQWNGLNVIAVRFNPSDATPGWNGDGHVWNQTGDITATADKNCVTITDWNTGTYGTYSTPTYTISYNAGTGGSGSKASETKTCGVDFTLPNSAVFTRTGYTQTGWTTSDGGAQTHALGGTYTTNADQAFYPVWTPVQYDVTLEKGSAAAAPAGNSGSAKVLYDATALTNITHATWTGHVLTGYYTSNTGGTKVLNADGSFAATNVSGYITDGKWTRAGNTTLRAQWTCAALTLVLDGDAATPAGGSPIGTEYTLTCSASTGTIASYQWKQNTTASTTGAVNAEGTGATTASFNPVPAAAGTYYYYCVATDACDNSVNTSFSGAFTFTAPVVPYATSIDFEAIIDESGTGAAWKTTMEGRNYTLTQADGTKWSLDGGNSGAKPADKGLKIKETGDNAGKITFTVRANQTVELKVGTLAGTNGGTAKFSTDGGSSYSNITGAATASTGASVVTTYTGATDRTYVFKTNSASWNILQHIIIGYKITYDKGANGTGTIDPMYKTHGTNINLSSSTFTYAGHTQDGWSTSDGGSKVYELGASYTSDAPITLYPHWVEDVVVPTITATKTSPDYVTTDPNNVVLSISTTGASAGWYYRVKNTGNDGYQTPDNTPYTTTSWTMTSGLSLGANNFVVELYNGSGVKQAESGTITVTAETAYPITIAAGAGGSVSPSGEIKANESGNHIHPAITATPSSGYHFVNWTYSNANATVADASSASTTISNAVGACTITANFEEDAPVATPMITWNLNVGTSASTTLKSSTSTTDGTNITNIDIDQTNDGANGAGASDRTTKLAIKTGANGSDWAGDPTNYEIFKFKVACGKKMTPSKIRMKVANVGSASANNIKYKAVMSDNFGHSLAGTYVVATQNGTVETFDIDNADASKYFQGEVTLKLWAWTIADKSSGGSDFRMGTPLEIYGEVANQATPAATITWTTQPANGQVGDPDFAYAVSCSDGSAVTVTSANTTYATIVGGKLHYAAAGTTHLVATATDACGNAVVQNSNNFTVTVPVTYSITYHCNGAESGCPSDVAATTNLPNPLPSAPTKDGYDFGGWFTDSECTVAAVAGAALTGNTDLYAKWTVHSASECITIAYFETTSHNNSSSKPDNAGKYIYGYTNSAKTEAYAYTITSSTGDNKGQGTGESDYLRMNYGTTVTIYADNTTTGGTPASFSNVTSVSVDFKMMKSSYYTSFDIYVGGTKIANNVSLEGAAQSAFTTFTYDNLEQLSGTVRIVNKGSGSSNYHFYVDNIVICTASMSSCTTPTLPTATLNDQVVCEGSDITAWDATPTNASTISSKSESISYSWKKKGNDTELAPTATFDLGASAAESQAGTYVVTVTVSKAGYASASASKEVELSVTDGEEVTSIVADKATVYPGNSVTLTATANTPATWQWYTCTNAEGDGEAIISGAESASYTIASAGAAGTYYYKAVATGSCGTAERVYTLTVTAASECQKYFWFVYAADATSNGVINNRDNFFGSSPKTGSSNSSTYKFTLDGTEYTATRNTGDNTFSISFTVPEGSTATLALNCKGSSSKPIYLIPTSGDPVLITDNSSNAAHVVENIAAGTYKVGAKTDASASWTLAGMAVQVCTASTCTDATPTIAAANTTVCVGSELSISSTGYETGATFQWQKLNSSTSTWDNISGATSATYTVTAAAEHAGSYRLVATKGCARTSNTVTISVPTLPDFGSTVPASVSVMQTIALSINTVEATDAVKYRWYKSADAIWDAGDTEIGTNKELIKAYDGEAIGSPSYYIFCRAQNACGITTSSAIAVNVTAYVEEDCATRGNESDAEFGFQNSGAGQGSYESTACWTMNSNSKILIYSAPDGKYFKTMKVTIASSSASKASYNWSTDGGTTYTSNGVAITGVTTTLTEKTINLSAHGNVNEVKIGRNFGNGESSGTLYVSKICFEYTSACTATTVTPSTASTNYEMDGSSFTEPTFTVKHGGTAFDPQPTLTYSSSNEDIASVDDDGTVTFNGDAGTVTITASYAGDGTYCASSGSYIINVSCPGGAPKIVPGGTVNMSGCNSSVVLNAKEQDGTTDFTGGSYQWLRNGEEIDGATNKSYTATQAGIYTVEYTSAGGCTSVSTNSAVVTSTTTEPEVERLVPFQYYHVDKTYSDQMKMRHLFAVKNSGKLDGKSFKMYVSRNGGAATDVTSSNALVVWPNGDGHVDTVMVDLNKLSGKYSENDELVFTCKAIDCSGNVSDVYKETITMRVIGATPTLALILNGKGSVVGGDFLEDYEPKNLQEQTGSKTWGGEWPMYTDLKTEFSVTPVNGYAPFNKLNYEPFDIIFLTDFPKASKSDAAATILDDMYELVDFRPMFSFKTHMVHKSPSKWALKGFTTSPTENKGDGRTYLNIVCYAHPMFEDIKTGDEVYTDASDGSELVYEMLSGTGYEKNKGMQGFEIDAAENFVTIGLTHYNASVATAAGVATWTPGDGDRMLVSSAERQANPEARMILMSLNAGAHSKLTAKGRAVVMKSLEYLIQTSGGLIEPADCSYTFDNAAGDHNWSTAGNWGPRHNAVPGPFTSTRIAAAAVVDIAHAHAMEVRIVEGGSIEIPAGKGLEVKSTVRHIDGAEISPTEVAELSIGSASSGNGTLIFNNKTGDTKAGVAMYSKASIINGVKNYQYMGVPCVNINALYNYYGSWIYSWSKKVGGSYGWEKVKKGGIVTTWTGYCITQESPVTYAISGTLAATGTVDINVPAGENMVVGNSWTAPIDINALTEDDLEGLVANIYFFNTGVDKDYTSGHEQDLENRYAPSTYVTVPIHDAPYTGDDHIPSLQGFFVKNTSGSAGTLHLDYDRHVRGTTRSSILSGEMHAPARRATVDNNEPEVLKIKVSGEKYDDKLLLLAREDFSTGFDNGWDGDKWDGNESALYIYTKDIEGTENSVSAIPEMEGTVIGFRAGEDEAYTLHFEYLNGYEPLYLYDTETKMYSPIQTGATYWFMTNDKQKHERFIITRTNGQEIGTGVEDVQNDKGQSTKARKLLINDKMYILINGTLYDATGKVVK